MCPCYATNLSTFHVKSGFSRWCYNKPVNTSEKKKVMEQFSDLTRIKSHPESLYDFRVYYILCILNFT